MIVQIVVVFHLIAAVKIIIFARARAVTLENVSLIVEVYKCFITSLTNSSYSAVQMIFYDQFFVCSFFITLLISTFKIACY